MARRSKAREVVLQMLYQADVNPDVDAQTVHRMIDDRLVDESLSRFGWELYAGVMECRPQLDHLIEQHVENWSLGRMAPTDRNVLRLGAFELQHTDTPHRVVIDEAIEIVKRFSTEKSGAFVNGILDRVLKEREEAHGTG